MEGCVQAKNAQIAVEIQLYWRPGQALEAILDEGMAARRRATFQHRKT
jgi:hypothetical protein